MDHHSMFENQQESKKKKTDDVFGHATDKKALYIVLGTDNLANVTPLEKCSNTEKLEIILNVCEEQAVNLNYDIADSTLPSITKFKPEKQSSNEGNDEHSDDVVPSIVSNQLQSPNIYTLPNELLLDIFGCLSVKELGALRHTSTLFRQLAGYCFQRNYPFTWAVYEGNEKGTICDENGVPLLAFKQFVRNIDIMESQYFQTFVDEQVSFQQLNFDCLRQLNLRKTDLTGIRIEYLTEFLNKLEHLTLGYCKMDGNSVENILTLTPNLRILEVLCPEHEDWNSEESWLQIKYPTLNEVSFVTWKSVTITNFLENNPNIRRFVTNNKLLWENRDSLRSANLKLDKLTFIAFASNDPNMDQTLLLLNELYEGGLYQQLKLYAISELNLDILYSLKAIVTLNPTCKKQRVQLSALKTLECLCTPSIIFLDMTGIEAAPSKLVHLKRVEIFAASIEEIIPFIKWIPNLEELLVTKVVKKGPKEVSDLKNIEDRTIPINLVELNNERAKLVGAKKIALYVPEPIYLITKLPSQETVLEFIRMKCITSNDLFESYWRKND